MAFGVGDAVHIPGIGTGLIREVRSGRRYVVMVKNATMVVAEAQLRPVEETKRRGRRGVADGTSGSQLTSVRADARAASSIDLHGRTVAEAEAAVDVFLNDALLAGLAEVRIVHGRSGGRVKSAVHARLRQLSAVRSFRVDPRNPGVTIVAL